MGLKLTFIIKNTKQIGLNQTFQDSSGRTSFLKRSSIGNKLKQNRQTQQKPNQVDNNLVNHRVQSLRNSGGVPNRSRPSRLTF